MSTSAEFKIIVCPHAWFGLQRKAKKLFHKYQLDQTAERNGVLILIVEKDREFLIYGDEGVNTKVSPDFWLVVKEAMQETIVENGLAAGMAVGMQLIADVLITHFPQKEKFNELSNDIIFEK